MGTPLRMLIVEDSEDDAELLARLLGAEYEPEYERVDTPEGMSEALGRQEWDIVLADYSMPHFSGPEALTLLKESGLDLPFILVSGVIGEEAAVAAMKAGAHDYLLKDDLARLVPAVTRELKEAEMRRAHKRAEESLRESEERFRTLYMKTPIMMHSIDLEGRLLDVSDRWLETLGYERDEVLGKRSLEFLTDASRKEAETVHLPRFWRTGSAREVPYQFVTKSGEVIDVLLSATIMADEAGKPSASFGVLVDVTDRKQAEEALRLRNAAIDAAANGIVVADREGEIVWVNTAFTALTGYSFEEAVGQNPRLFKSGKHDQAFYKQLWDTVLSGQVWRGETINRRKDGSFYTEEQAITPVLDERGEITHFIAIKQDITERKQAEEALRALEQERYRRLLEVAPDGIVIIDDAGVIETVNARTEELFGYDRKELIGRPAEMLIPERYLEPHLAHSQAFTASPQARTKGQETDLHARRKDGREFPVDISVNALQTDGEIRIIASIHDVSERVKAERTLRESEARFSTAFHDNPVPVAISRVRDGKLIDVNDAFLSMTGQRRAETIGRTNIELGMQAGPAAREEVAEAIREHGTVLDSPAQLRRKMGDVLDVLATVTQIELEGQPCFLTTYVDVTERKRLEHELQQMRDDLESKVERRMAGENPYKLTFREFTVLHLIAAGKADKEIAAELGISIYTVHRHVSNILGKMDSPSRTEAGTRALREGLLD